MLRRGSGVPLNLGSWQAPRFYVYEAGEVPGVPKDLLYIKESAWGPAAAQVGPAPVFLGKHLELQATQANKTPLRGRKTIELGAGCGLVSMVASLLGAEAQACEEHGPTLALLQHNLATFNSEFTKCHPISACEFPKSAKFRGAFDLLFVTDLLNSPSARIKTLKCLLLLLGAQTDGSIDIFSVKPHADVSESVWRSEVEDLLQQLQQDESMQKCTHPNVTPVAVEGAGAAVGEASALCSEEKDTDRHGVSVSLSSCSTLSSMQGTVQLARSISSSGVLTPAERRPCGEDFNGELERPSQKEPAESGAAAVPAPKARTADDSSTPGLIRNMSQPLLHQKRLPLKTAHTVAAAKVSKAAPNGAPGVTASSCEPRTPADATRVRPKTSTATTHAARSRHLNSQQRTSVNRDGSYNDRREVATGSNGHISPRLSSAAKGPASPCPASPSQPLPATAATATRRSAVEKEKRLPGNIMPTPPGPREGKGGMLPTAATAAAPKAAAATTTLHRLPATDLQSSPAKGTTRLMKISSEGTTAPPRPAAVSRAAAETGVGAKPAVLKPLKSARPQTSVQAPQHSNKDMAPLLPALGTPHAQLRRPTADGSPTGSHETAAAYAPLRSRRKSLLEDATSAAAAAATAVPTTAVAAKTAHPKSTQGSALALNRCAAPNTGASHRMLKVAAPAAAGHTPRQPSAVGPTASRYSIPTAGGGTPKHHTATAAAVKPVAGSLGSVVGPKVAANVVPESAKAGAVDAEVHQPAAVGAGATKAPAIAQEESDKPRAPAKTKTDTASGGPTTAAGPLGARLVSRLSGLFKRAGSKEMKNKAS
ncbi:uncharacterized protein EMH_0040130 [Eimeria mitis]|uniref:Uncharacterized protein n=1 Tax=Eimeria mitis TaxID=44415 RepID=U6K1T8_9EIME|nr:uncharacterized protein EMH_0040130 [Eimeria mitis]CDJ31659.1 hypothetical protein EMH_0040130 [Eimeria mitis]